MTIFDRAHDGYYPHCLWIGKIIGIHEGARVVVTAEITGILNPVLMASDL